MLVQHAKQIKIAPKRSPRSEGHKCRMKRHAEFAESFDHLQEILARVPFVEEFQNGVVDGLHRADDEETSSIAKRGEMPLVFAQVLDFDRCICANTRGISPRFAI